jgi:hypothetical protein
MNFGQMMNFLWILEVWNAIKLFLELKIRIQRTGRIQPDSLACFSKAGPLAWLGDRHGLAEMSPVASGPAQRDASQRAQGALRHGAVEARTAQVWCEQWRPTMNKISTASFTDLRRTHRARSRAKTHTN